MLPTLEAKKAGYDQIIWTDGEEHQYVEESGTTNLFFVLNDNTIITPMLDGNILRGVTRDSCIKLLKAEGYTVIEKRISLNEISEAHNNGSLSDAFGTGTAALIAKIDLIDNDGIMYKLPNADDRKVSNWLYKKLSDTQTSKTTDPNNWVYKLI